MVLDRELFEKARTAGTTLADAERRTLLARADYHTAVRRLHLAGGSVREVAQALSISHQRVQQIVSGAGGSWWTRVWRTRRPAPDAVCTWCGRPPAEVDRLIAGPAVYICDACVAAAERVVSGGTVSGAFGRARPKGTADRCGFCSKRSAARRTLVYAPEGHVCSDCLRVCREILDSAG